MSINKYIEDFEEKATELAGKKINECPPVEERIKQVDEMVNHYFEYTGKFPKPFILELLGSYILVEELKDKDVDKITNKDFPIMSESQVNRRLRKRLLLQDDTIDFLNTKYNKQMSSLAKKTVKKAEY
ncbi:hypothetical protein ACIU4M_00555 [Bacillus altitudinis]|uniref:hypothetical protein n=1 Tax=Bacillus altitudinis TaxID=293387 RepID=UPI00389B0041